MAETIRLEDDQLYRLADMIAARMGGPSEYMTPDEFAAKIGMHPDNVRRACADGKINAVKSSKKSRRWKIPRTELTNWERRAKYATDKMLGRIK